MCSLFAEGGASNSTNPKDYIQQKPFFTLHPFSITVLSKNKPYLIVSIECLVETVPEKWEKMRLQVPKMYHHMLIDLYQSLNFLWNRKSPPDPMVLKKRLLNVLHTVMGKDNIKDLVVSSVYVSECEP